MALTIALGGALPRRPAAGRRHAALRHRPGRARPRPPPRRPPRISAARLRRPRARRVLGRRAAGGDVGGGRPRRAAAARPTGPRYLMGVGTPRGPRRRRWRPGCDLFDCVIPTRNARNGLLHTSRGPVVLKNARWKLCRRAARPRLRLPDLPPLLAGLPAPPLPRPRGRGGGAGDRPQPALLPLLDAAGRGGLS